MFRWALLFFFLIAAQPTLADPLGFARSLEAQGDCYRALSEVYAVEFKTGTTAESLALKLRCQAQEKDWNAWDRSLTQGINEKRLPHTEKQKIALQALPILWERQAEGRAQQLYQTHLYPTLGTPYPNEVPEQIDPDSARWASAIFPGSGLMMAGKWGPGLTSFGLNALFIWGTIEAYSEEQYALAALAFFFEWGWYFGGQEAAAEAANQHNQALSLQHRKTKLLDWQKRF